MKYILAASGLVSANVAWFMLGDIDKSVMIERSFFQCIAVLSVFGSSLILGK